MVKRRRVEPMLGRTLQMTRPPGEPRSPLPEAVSDAEGRATRAGGPGNITKARPQHPRVSIDKIDPKRREVDVTSFIERVRDAVSSAFEESALVSPSEDEQARAWAVIVEAIEQESRRRILSREQTVDSEERALIAERLFASFFRMGPLQPYLDDEEVEELIVNSPNQGFVVRAGGKKTPIDPNFSSADEVRALLSRVVARAGRRVDDSSPAVDVSLPDGTRLHAVLPPLSIHVCLTLRRHRLVAQSLDELAALKAVTSEAAAFLKEATERGLNILVSGGTASGKTTTLNALGSAIPAHERVITVEETSELRLAELLPDCVALETRTANAEGIGRVSIRELVRHALRMRPTRIIVGEVRGPEALDMISAMNTGHEGSMGTIHANSARQALSKLRTHLLMAEEHISPEVATEMIAETVNLVVHLKLQPATGSRSVVQIAEVAGMESGSILTNDLFRFEEGALVATGVRSRNVPPRAATSSKLAGTAPMPRARAPKRVQRNGKH